jgi:3-isopropylmalate dehydrogenase
MKQHDVAIIAGDGIGPEVTTEAFKVVRAAASRFGFEVRENYLPLGTNHYLETGEIFPDARFEEVKQRSTSVRSAIRAFRSD